MNRDDQLNAKNHPSAETLFLAIEGGLGAAEALQVEDHLKVCWECRTESEQMQNGIFAFMDYRKHLVLPKIEPPPHNWERFPALLEQTIKECEQVSAGRAIQLRAREALGWLRSLLAGLVSVRMRPAWISAAAAAVLCLVVFFSFSWLAHPPIVSAKEFLLRAAESRQSLGQGVRNPVIHQRVRIRSGKRSVTRDLYQTPNSPSELALANGVPRAALGESDAELQEVFASCHLDWNDPLNAAVFAAWHDALPAKQDQVTSEGSGHEQRITLTTRVSSAGRVREGSLTVLAMNWHPVEERLRLENDAELEITELAFDVTSGPLSPPAAAPLRKASGPRNEITGSSESELEASEIQARAALHRIGADLGEQIEIRHTAVGRVRIEGLVSSGERKQELAQALQAIPRVEPEIRVIAELQPPQTALKSAATLEEQSQLQPVFHQRLLGKFSAPAEQQQFVNDVLAASQQMLVRAWALRRLAERYNSGEVKRLDRVSRATLDDLLRSHLEDLRRQIATTQWAFATLTAQSAPAAPTVAESTRADWQTEVIRIFAAVEKIDHAWTTALAGSEAASQSDTALTENLTRLYAEVEAYLNQLAQDLPSPQAPKRDE